MRIHVQSILWLAVLGLFLPVVTAQGQVIHASVVIDGMT